MESNSRKGKVDGGIQPFARGQHSRWPRAFRLLSNKEGLSMTATRLALIVVLTLAALQTVYADSKKGGGTTTATASNPSGPVPVPYPNAAKNSIMKSKHDTSKNSVGNVK